MLQTTKRLACMALATENGRNVVCGDRTGPVKREAVAQQRAVALAQQAGRTEHDCRWMTKSILPLDGRVLY